MRLFGRNGKYDILCYFLYFIKKCSPFRVHLRLAIRVGRLVQLGQNYKSTRSILFEVGLGHSGIWIQSTGRKSSRRCTYLFLCLMYTLQNIPTPRERREICCGVGETESQPFFVSILMTLVRTEIPWDNFEVRVYRCQQLLDFLGGANEVGTSVIEECIFEVTQILLTCMNSSTNAITHHIAEIGQGICIFDWLLSLLRLKVAPEDHICFDADSVDPSEIVEGDILWYMVDGNRLDSDRVNATVIKIHTDDYPNLYFTINIQDEVGSSTSRQTVANRLKKREKRKLTISNSNTAFTSDKFIATVEERIMHQIIIPFLNYDSPIIGEAAAECFNIVISRCGFKGKAGIGSARFDAFTSLSSLESELILLLSDKTLTERSLSLFKRICFILGQGNFASTSHHNSEILRFGCERLMDSIIEHFETDNHSFNGHGALSEELNASLLAWLRICATSSLNEKYFTEMWLYLDEITSLALKKNLYGRVTFWSLSSLNAFLSLSRVSMNISSSKKPTFLDSEHHICSNLIEMYIRCDDMEIRADSFHADFFHEGNGLFVESTDPLWMLPFETFISNAVRAKAGTILHATKIQAEKLMPCLNSSIKQTCAFQMLTLVARTGEAMYLKDEFKLSEGTLSKLNKWKEGMMAEEATEIEEAVYVSAEWLPHSLMRAIESYDHQILDLEDDGFGPSLVVRLLQWLLCLEFVDAASFHDMRNRPHLTSYIKQTFALREILETSVCYLNFQEPCDMDCVAEPSLLLSQKRATVPRLCTIAMFRSVESMPTLCKAWWSDYCPRRLRPVMSKFVENSVAPETLRRELVRISKALNLGELSVSGSCVSREVVATYVQDEVRNILFLCSWCQFLFKCILLQLNKSAI